MRKQHIVMLSEAERAPLLTLIGRGAAPARAQTHARILLKANQGEAGPAGPTRRSAAALEVDPTTVARVRQLYVTEGLEAALHRKAPDRVYRRKLDGEQEARLVAVGVQRAAERPQALDAAAAGRPAGRAGGRRGPSRTRRSGRP